MDDPVEISRPADSHEREESEVKIDGFESLASYNWLDRGEPSVLVPGIPPIWSRPSVAPHLKPDTGTRYIDQNADRYPWSPLEPLIRAVYEMHPKFDFGAVDVVTDRRPLRKLIGFVEHEVEDFEFGVEAIGNTVLFEAYTKISSSAEGSTSHHRIARYSLAGLKLLVRSAFDAYLEDVAAKPEASTGSGKERFREEDLTSYMEAASFGGDPPSIIDTPEAPGLHVIQGGEEIRYAALAEFKTRTKFGKSLWNIEEKLPDLWLSQTPTLIEAAHQNVGTKWSRAQVPGPRMAEFVDITVRDMHAELNNWQTRNSTTIRGFSSVLKTVVAMARASSCPLIVRYLKERDKLVIAKAETGGVPTLPVEIRRQWSVIKEAE